MKDPIEFNHFISTAWNPESIRERHDWMFKYDVKIVTI